MLDQESLYLLASRDLLAPVLDNRAKAMLNRVAVLDHGLALIRYLCTSPRALRTSEDIAFWINGPREFVERDLLTLSQMGLVQIVRTNSSVFFGATIESPASQIMQNLSTWLDYCLARLQAMREAIVGTPPLHEHVD